MRYFHIAFNFKGPDKIKELEPVFDDATDWLRYSANCWVVYIAKVDEVLILEVDIGTWVRV